MYHKKKVNTQEKSNIHIQISQNHKDISTHIKIHNLKLTSP